jgi:8-oxo-dGTP pyrophosphatase MutT (NUDIX family)
MQEAAVLVPIYRGRDGELRLVLVRRTDTGIHGGQIAFPGGKRTRGDRTLLETALRETREEIGIPSDAIEILEHLPVMETRTTGFRIYPFLARVVRPLEWCLEEQEVAEVLEVRIRDLACPEAQGEEIRHFSTGSEPQGIESQRSEPRQVSFYRVGPYKLWGATYRILKPLIPRLIAGEWSR